MHSYERLLVIIIIIITPLWPVTSLVTLTQLQNAEPILY